MQQLLPLEIWHIVTTFASAVTLSRLRLVTRGATTMWANAFDVNTDAKDTTHPTLYVKHGNSHYTSLPFISALMRFLRDLNTLCKTDEHGYVPVVPTYNGYRIKMDPSHLDRNCTSYVVLVNQERWVPEPVCLIHKRSGMILWHKALKDIARHHTGTNIPPAEKYLFSEQHRVKEEDTDNAPHAAAAAVVRPGKEEEASSTMIKYHIKWNPTCSIYEPNSVHRFFYKNRENGCIEFWPPYSTNSGFASMPLSDYEEYNQSNFGTQTSYGFSSFEDMQQFLDNQEAERQARRKEIVTNAAGNPNDESLLAMLDGDEMSLLCSHPMFYKYRVDDSYTWD